jgi:hypothetical protein
VRLDLGRTIRLGVSSLLLHKLRSVLTTLGVLFGVSSVIAMLAIGEGASEEAQEQIRRLGSQNVILRSLKPPDEPSSGRETTRVLDYGLRDADYARVSETFPAVRRAVPVRQLQQEVRLGVRALNPRVLATKPQYIDVTHVIRPDRTRVIHVQIDSPRDECIERNGGPEAIERSCAKPRCRELVGNRSAQNVLLGKGLRADHDRRLRRAGSCG